MKKIAFVVIGLCSLSARCPFRDTQTRKLWLRPTESRFVDTREWQPCRAIASNGDRVVAAVQCGDARSFAAQETCDDEITSRPAAASVVLQKQCTDKAIAALDRLSIVDPKALSDLSAAYLFRAQRDDRASDLLRALDEADRAIASASDLLPPRFNRALALEALALDEEAISAWDDYAKRDRSAWGDEAQQHAQWLRARNASALVTRWPATRARLETALAAANTPAVRTIVSEFVGPVLQYLEETLLDRYAREPSSSTLQQAQLLANALYATNGDRYPVDLVAAASTAADAPRTRAALRDAHTALAAAVHDVKRQNNESAAANYTRAAESFRTAGSPLQLITKAHALLRTSMPSEEAAAAVLHDFDALLAAAGAHRHLHARIAADRAFVLHYVGRYSDSFAAYDEARAAFASLHDDSNVANMTGHMAGELSELKHTGEAFATALRGARHATDIIERRARHLTLGSAALAASDLQFTGIALQYQNAAVRMLRNELVATSPDDLNEIADLQYNIGVVLRERARYETALGDVTSAQRDLVDVTYLIHDATKEDAEARAIAEARVATVSGELLMSTDPAAAIEAFTRALTLGGSAESSTPVATLLVKRARAEQRLGRTAEAETDLRKALAQIREEETKLLHNRRIGEGETLWTDYFLRFQETYEVLIRQLVETNRHREAFAYAEKARAFEPLTLLAQRGLLPEAVRDLVSGDMDVARIQSLIPDGTFLLEYSVQQERTYTWVVSRHDFRLVTQRAPQADVARWSDTLQRLAESGTNDDGAADSTLRAAYAGLLAEPMKDVHSLAGGTLPRVVIIPDGAMHGLPFAALRNNDPETDFRPLIDEAIVSVHGSTLLYLFSRLRADELARAAKAPSELLVGNPAFDPKLRIAERLDRLPYAEAEVHDLKAVYGDNAVERIGPDATVPAFLELARNRDIIHVAAHAVANPQTPSQSAILLAPSAHDDGVLDAQELVKQFDARRAQLVILGTCTSAGGAPVGPEGLAPLVRPLIAAGVPAVVGSLWRVDDATTRELLVSFHRHLKENRNDAETALRLAQRDLRESPALKTVSIFQWASFQVIGHSSPFAPTTKR